MKIQKERNFQPFSWLKYWAVWYVVLVILCLKFMDYQRPLLRRLDAIRHTGSYPIPAFQRNRWEREAVRHSIKYYTLLKTKEPSPRVYEMLGLCYYMLGEDKKAIDAYEESLKRGPQYFWVEYNLAVLYWQNQDYPNAVLHFQHLAEGKPEQLLRHSVFFNFQKLSPSNKREYLLDSIRYLETLQKISREAVIIGRALVKDPGSQTSPSGQTPPFLLHPWATFFIGTEDLVYRP